MSFIFVYYFVDFHHNVKTKIGCRMTKEERNHRHKDNSGYYHYNIFHAESCLMGLLQVSSQHCFLLLFFFFLSEDYKWNVIRLIDVSSTTIIIASACLVIEMRKNKERKKKVWKRIQSHSSTLMDDEVLIFFFAAVLPHDFKFFCVSNVSIMCILLLHT